MTDLADTIADILASERQRVQADIDAGRFARNDALADEVAALRREVASLKATLPKQPEQTLRLVHELAPANVVYNAADTHIHMPEQAPPIVNATTYVEPVVIPAPEVNIEGTVVNVPPTAVSVKADVAAPEVTIHQPEVQKMEIVAMPTRTSTSRKKVKRDKTGLITEVLEETVDE